MSDNSDYDLKTDSGNSVTEAVRRKKPQNYDDLMDVMTELEENAIDKSLVLELRDIFEIISVLVTKYKTNKDQIIKDSILMMRIADLQLKCFNAVSNRTNTYNTGLFALRLKNKLGDVMKSLTKVTNTFITPLPSVRGILMIQLAGLSVTEQEDEVEEEEETNMAEKKQLEAKRARKRPRVEEPVAKEVTPKKISGMVQEEEMNSKDIKKLSNRILGKFNQNRKPHLDFYKTLFSRKSFSKTMENMFFFSFLVHDQALGVDIKGSNSIQIRKIPDCNHDDNHEEETGQFIASFDYDDWQNMCNQSSNNQEQVTESESDEEMDSNQQT